MKGNTLGSIFHIFFWTRTWISLFPSPNFTNLLSLSTKITKQSVKRRSLFKSNIPFNYLHSTIPNKRVHNFLQNNINLNPLEIIKFNLKILILLLVVFQFNLLLLLLFFKLYYNIYPNNAIFESQSLLIVLTPQSIPIKIIYMKKNLYELFQKTKPNSIDLNKVKIGTRLQTELSGFKIIEESPVPNKPPIQIIEIASQQQADPSNMVNRFDKNQPETNIIQKHKSPQNKYKRPRRKSLDVQQIIYENIQGKNKNIFKQFFRITNLLDRKQIRSLDVLKIAFEKLKNLEQTDPQLCFEQIQSLRQDLHVQNLQNQFVVEVLEFSILFSLKNKKITYMFQCIVQLKLISQQLNIKIQPQFISYYIYYLVLNDLFVELQTLIMILKPQILLSQQVKKAFKFYSLMTVKNYPKIYQTYFNSTTNEKYIFEFYEQKLCLQNLQILVKSINKYHSIYSKQSKKIWASLLNNPDPKKLSQYLSQIH